MGESGHLRGHVATVVTVALVAFAFLILLLKLAGSVSFGSTHKIKAVVAQAGSLTQGTSVTMAGARIGTVTGVQRRGVGALVSIRVDKSEVWPLPADSRAKLSVRTPLGENYIQLLPGKSKQTIAENGIVAPEPDDSYVDVDQILSVLNGKTRNQARQMIQGLGDAVADRGDQLNTTVGATSGVLKAGSSLTQRLKGDREQIGSLVQQLGQLGNDVGERSESIRALATQGLTTFRALGARDTAVKSLLDELPGTLDQVKTTTGTLQQVSNAATPVVANLANAVREVRPAVRSLAPAAATGQGVVTELAQAAPKLQTTLDAVKKAQPSITPALPEIQKTVCQINPALHYLSPYTADILSLITGFTGATTSYDAIGHTLRLMPVFNEESLSGLPDNYSKAANDLVHAGFVQKSNGLSWEPFPDPGHANDSVSPSQHNLGPEDVAKSGYKFPRIQSDC